MKQQLSQESNKQNKIKELFLNLLFEIKDLFKNAWNIIISNKAQAFLTLIGFFIASFLVTSILLGAHSSMIADGYGMSPLGANTLTLNLNDGTWLDADDLIGEFKDSKVSGDVVPMQRIENVEMYGNSKKSFSYPVIVTDSLFFENAAVYTVKGRPLSDADVSSRKYNAAVSADAAKELFGDADPVGQDIKLNNQVYNVTGVFEGKSKFAPGCLVVIPRKSARILLGASDVNTYVFTNVDNEDKAKAEISSFTDKRIDDRKKTSSSGGDFGYSIDYNGIEKNTAYIIGIIMYIIMLLISGIGLLLFVLFPNGGDLIVCGKAQNYSRAKLYIMCNLVCIIISMIGGVSGLVIGIPAGILYCAVVSIQPVFDMSLLWLILAVLGLSLLFGALIGTAPGIKWSKDERCSV